MLKIKNKVKSHDKNSSISFFISLGIHIILAGILLTLWKQYLPVFHNTNPNLVRAITTFEVTTTSFSVKKPQDMVTYGTDQTGEFNIAQNQLTIEQQIENTAHMTEYEPSLLPDIKPAAIPNNFRANENAPAVISSGNTAGSTGSSSGNVVYNAAELSAAPKQTVEVFPEMAEKSVRGTVSLSLRIGLDGRVKEFKITKNTMDCPDCLKKIIEAAQKSRWEKVTYKGSQVEYWIDKSYIFN